MKAKTDWALVLFFAWLCASIAFLAWLLFSFFALPTGLNTPKATGKIPTFDRRIVSSWGFPKPLLLGDPSVILISRENKMPRVVSSEWFKSTTTKFPRTVQQGNGVPTLL